MKETLIICLFLIVILLPSCHGCYEISYDDYDFQKRKDKNYYHPLLRYDGYYILSTPPINFYQKKCDTCKKEVFFAIGYRGIRLFNNGIYFISRTNEKLNDIIHGNIDGFYGYYHIEDNNLFLEKIRFCYLTKKVKTITRYEIFSDRFEIRYTNIELLNCFGKINLNGMKNRTDNSSGQNIYYFYKVKEQYLDTLKPLEELNFQ